MKLIKSSTVMLVSGFLIAGCVNDLEDVIIDPSKPGFSYSYYADMEVVATDYGQNDVFAGDGGCECSTGQMQCASAYILKTCDDGCRWTRTNCKDACIKGGYSSMSEKGCGYDTEDQHDVCWCVE